MGKDRQGKWRGRCTAIDCVDKTIRDAIASFTGSSATLTPEQQKEQQEVEGGGDGGWCVCVCVCVCVLVICTF